MNCAYSTRPMNNNIWWKNSIVAIVSPRLCCAACAPKLKSHVQISTVTDPLVLRWAVYVVLNVCGNCNYKWCKRFQSHVGHKFNSICICIHNIFICFIITYFKYSWENVPPKWYRKGEHKLKIRFVSKNAFKICICKNNRFVYALQYGECEYETSPNKWGRNSIRFCHVISLLVANRKVHLVPDNHSHGRRSAVGGCRKRHWECTTIS